MRADGSRGEAVHGVEEDLLERTQQQHLELARAELLPFNPETSAVRMRWARATVAVLDGQSAPRIRRIAAADRSALATNPAAGLSAIRSA